MVVGTDSYVSIEEANTIVSETYLSDEVERTTWESLSDTDKEILLKRATRDIDTLMFRGTQVQLKSVQLLKFPRVIDCIIVEINNYIKGACVFQAISYKTSSKSKSNLRKELQSQGVTSVSIGKISESYDIGSSKKLVEINSDSLAYLDRYIAKGGVIV